MATLTALQIRNLKPGAKKTTIEPGLLLIPRWREFDGKMLPRHSWVLDYRRPADKVRDSYVLGYYLGDLGGMSLAQAQKAAADARTLIEAGTDPKAASRADREAAEKAAAEDKARAELAAENARRAAAGMDLVFAPGTLGAVYETRMAAARKELKALTVKDGMAQMRNHVLPVLGNTPVTELKRKQVLMLGHAIAEKSPAVARKCLGQIRMTLDYAVLPMGLLEENPCPAVWSQKELPKKPRTKRRPAVTTEADVADLMTSINEDFATRDRMRDCYWFLAWTFQRVFTVVSMRWADLDLDAAMWTIPAAVMKGKLVDIEHRGDHHVPLPRQMVARLRELKADAVSQYVLPAYDRSLQHMNDDTPAQQLALTKWKGRHVPHGFRAMARSMIPEKLGLNRDMVERHLAHASDEELGDTYDRAMWLEERKPMAQAWADYLDRLTKTLHDQPMPGDAPRLASNSAVLFMASA